MIPIQILVVFVTCAGLVNPAATGPRQERRLEDSGHFNAGFVEYKSKGDSVVNGDDEIDEYVVIETNDREKDDNKIVDDPYEEVDNHYDDDLEDEEHPILNKSVTNHGLVPQVGQTTIFNQCYITIYEILHFSFIRHFLIISKYHFCQYFL